MLHVHTMEYPSRGWCPIKGLPNNESSDQLSQLPRPWLLVTFMHSLGLAVRRVCFQVGGGNTTTVSMQPRRLYLKPSSSDSRLRSARICSSEVQAWALGVMTLNGWAVFVLSVSPCNHHCVEIEERTCRLGKLDDEVPIKRP
jgi:hypothetical protein